MMPNKDSHAIRSNPRYYDGVSAGVQRVSLAWRGSSQLMRQEVAIEKINACAEELFSSEFKVSIEWLNGVNRLLWVLTSGSVARLDSNSHQRLSRIWEAVKEVYQMKDYSGANPCLFAQEDPQKEDLSLEELLLQIQGRCQLLDDLFQTCSNFENSLATIEELKRKLQESIGDESNFRDQLEKAREVVTELKKVLLVTQEKEKKLLKELSNSRDYYRCLQEMNQEKNEQLLNEQLRMLAEKQSEVNTLNAVIKLLRSERDRVKAEKHEEEKRFARLQDYAEELKEKVEYLTMKLAAVRQNEKVKEVEVVVGKDQSERITLLEKENARLKEKVKFFEEERVEALAVFEKSPKVVFVQKENIAVQ